MSSRRWASVMAGLVGVVALVSGFSWARSQAGTQAATAINGRVAYELAWSWEGARKEGGSYAFTTDRGYSVHLSAAYIGTASLELVPCRTEVTNPPLKAALDFFLPLQAQANHGYLHDTSLLEGPFVDSAFSDAPTAFGTPHTSGKSYCQLHELIVPLDQTGADGFHLEHWSAFIKGSYAMPGSSEEHAFDAHVNLRGGALVDLIPPTAPLSGVATVRVTRSPLHAFDGVQMEKLTTSELAYAFLRGLTKGTRAEVLAR